VVSLSSQLPNAAGVPPSVTVPAGATTATFTVTTFRVADTTVLLSAQNGDTILSVGLRITTAASEQPATLTVNATGRSGTRVTSTPTGINVAVGSNASAQFPAGTTITLSVSNGRTAIWSGACSSNGSKTKACTFTLTADANTTAYVQ
jgi:hypothetical protein